MQSGRSSDYMCAKHMQQSGQKMNAIPLHTVLLLLAALVSFQAGAAESGSSSSPEALFEKGTSLFQKGDYAAAARAFREANEVRPTWRLHYNIGQSEAAAKHHGRALEAFEAYLSEGGDDVPADRREEVIREIEQLRKMVGMLDIRAPDGAVAQVLAR